VQALRCWLREFLFPVESVNWLAVFRLGVGVELLSYCLSLRQDWDYMFTTTGSGAVTRELSEAIVSANSPLIPRLGWLVMLGETFGAKESETILCVWACLLIAACCLMLGLCCRTSAITAWFLHLCAAKSGLFFAYGVDNFTTIGLFYLMLAPFPDRYSIDYRIRKLRLAATWRLGFHRRVLQIHLCVIYFFGGLTKCIGFGWWNGTSLWRAMIRPPFNAISPHILIHWKLLFPVIGASVCILESAYPVFISLRRTRLAWLVSIVAMHVAIGFLMGMYLFALIMIVLNLAAFGPTLTGWKRKERTSDAAILREATSLR
jgi:hypothetical protein